MTHSKRTSKTRWMSSSASSSMSSTERAKRDGRGERGEMRRPKTTWRRQKREEKTR